MDGRRLLNERGGETSCIHCICITNRNTHLDGERRRDVKHMLTPLHGIRPAAHMCIRAYVSVCIRIPKSRQVDVQTVCISFYQSVVILLSIRLYIIKEIRLHIIKDGLLYQLYSIIHISHVYSYHTYQSLFLRCLFCVISGSA
jgi:hypothetical protein